jgi:hypothetical protein
VCCFSRPVKHVSATHIFARHVGAGESRRQALVYSMNVEIDADLAMVLPIPVVATARGAEDAVSFVDLSAYPQLFVDLRAAFPELLSYPKGRGLRAPQSRLARPKLEVHDVGAFVASFVPSPRDFDRLDDRFRLSPTVFAARKEYADYGFAVFQLKPQKGWFGKIKRQTVHPMAFTFPSRRPRALFYPTLHVHDQAVPDEASFDHSLYCQTDDPVLDGTLPFERSEKNVGAHVDASRTQGLVDGAAIALRQVVIGTRANTDHWYDPPACSGAHVLRGEGELFAFKLSATAAYYTEFGHPPARRWREVARTKLDALHAALLEGALRLTSERRDDWRLIPLTEDLAKAWLSNDDVYCAGQTGFERADVGKELPLRLAIATRTDAVETQQVDLGFRYVPPPEVIAEIRGHLDAIVSRAVA